MGSCLGNERVDRSLLVVPLRPPLSMAKTSRVSHSTWDRSLVVRNANQGRLVRCLHPLFSHDSEPQTVHRGPDSRDRQPRQGVRSPGSPPYVNQKQACSTGLNRQLRREHKCLSLPPPIHRMLQAKDLWSPGCFQIQHLHPLPQP